MPKIKPYKGIFVKDIHSKKFPVKSIENISPENMELMYNAPEFNFVDIIYPTVAQNDDDQETRYQKVRDNIEEYLRDDLLVKSNQKALYIYEISVENHRKYLGLVGITELSDYEQGGIKKHENTIQKREELFADYLKSVHFQAEPILLTFEESSKFEVLLDLETQSKPMLKFEDAEEHSTHKIWKIDNRLKVKQIEDSLASLHSLYIADGHHRVASTKLYKDYMKDNDKEYIGNEEYNFALSYIIPSHYLKIFEYNRLLTTKGNLSSEELLAQIAENFTIIDKGEKPYYPSHKHHISMYMDGKFYGLYVKHELRGTPEGLGLLDTYLFEELLLKPIFQITDTRNDDRIDFIKGTGDMEGILKIKDKVDNENFEIGFGFYPVHFHDLKKIADLGLHMPPKSTYIKPKLHSGMFIFDTKPQF